MGTKHLRALVVFTSAALLMFVGNAAEAQKAKNKVIITLLSPAANVVVAQNDPATGCPATPTHPYGYMINFSWSDSPLRNGSTYTVQIQHAGSTFPIVVGEGLTTSTYAFVDCNGFIVDANLSNWSWEVMRVRGNGAVARVSAQRFFRFGPCRDLTGAACASLP